LVVEERREQEPRKPETARGEPVAEPFGLTLARARPTTDLGAAVVLVEVVEERGRVQLEHPVDERAIR